MKYLLILLLCSCSIKVKYDYRSGYYVSKKANKQTYPKVTDYAYKHTNDSTYVIWIDKRKNRYIILNNKKIKLKPR